jgi:hypothetical protein
LAVEERAWKQWPGGDLGNFVPRLLYFGIDHRFASGHQGCFP